MRITIRILSEFDVMKIGFYTFVYPIEFIQGMETLTAYMVKEGL